MKIIIGLLMLMVLLVGCKTERIEVTTIPMECYKVENGTGLAKDLIYYMPMDKEDEIVPPVINESSYNFTTIDSSLTIPTFSWDTELGIECMVVCNHTGNYSNMYGDYVMSE